MCRTSPFQKNHGAESAGRRTSQLWIIQFPSFFSTQLLLKVMGIKTDLLATGWFTRTIYFGFINRPRGRTFVGLAGQFYSGELLRGNNLIQYLTCSQLVPLQREAFIWIWVVTPGRLQQRHEVIRAGAQCDTSSIMRCSHSGIYLGTAMRRTRWERRRKHHFGDGC